MNKSLLKRSINLIFSLKNYYHSHYDPKLNFFIEFNSMKTVFNNRTKVVFLDFERIKGIPIRLRFYDSHRHQPEIKFHESTLPTILILPSGEFKIEDYNFLIGNLVKENNRVIALEFPGIYS